MKKIRVIVVYLIAFICFATLSFAGGTKGTPSNTTKHKAEIIIGKIVSVDPVKNEIVIKEDKTGIDKTIQVRPKTISSLKIGEHVKAKLKPQDNKAESVKIIRKHKAEKPK